MRNCHSGLSALPTGRTGAVTGVMKKQTQKYCRLSSTLSAICRVMVIDACGASCASNVAQRDSLQPPVNAKRLYRIMSEHNLLLLHHKPERPKREHKGKIAVAESDMRWCSDGFEFGCDNGEKLRVTFALDCCDREAIDWAASTGGYDSSTVQDVMLRSVEKRFGDRLPDTAVQWLTDNGSAYTAYETRRFARELNLEPCTTAVSSPQSNGMAERFVKTMKEDYIAFMPKPDVRTALRNLAVAFTHYNENHPHSALGYHSPREYRRQRTSLT